MLIALDGVEQAGDIRPGGWAVNLGRHIRRSASRRHEHTIEGADIDLLFCFDGLLAGNGWADFVLNPSP